MEVESQVDAAAAAAAVVAKMLPAWATHCNSYWEDDAPGSMYSMTRISTRRVRKQVPRFESAVR